MTDLLLSHAYFLAEDEKERAIMKPYPTLGLLYISAYLKRAGFSVEVFDTTFATRADLEERLAKERGVLGLYTNLMTRAATLEIVAKAKALGWTVVLGGPESAGYPERYLAAGADVIVLGEGEEAMRDLLPALASRGSYRLHDVLGLVFTDEAGAVVTTPDRPKVPDLDALPFPDRGAIDQARYVDVWRAHHGMGSVNLITARGCPYKCNWCSHAVYGFSHRRRSPKGTADEVEVNRDAYRPDQLWYADDVFTINHRWLFDFAAELKRRGIRLPFETISRADRLMSDDVMRTLKELGCYRIWIGSESGSQRILDAMERGVTVEQVQWATKAAQRHGIEVGMFLMWGYDGEELTDIEATIEHVKAANPDIFFTTVAYPIKKTGYFEKVAPEIVLDRDWSSATDRDYKVKGRHSRAYYRFADQWLRNDVAAYRLEASDPAAAVEKRVEAARAKEALLAAAHEVEA
ncbi:MAG TPA: radical SAM protein [Thermoanaerobaculia bacterium]|nr:radical SAM protein [Thermoanaerobaculia bacterium]